MAASNFYNLDPITFRLGSCNIVIKPGNLLDEKDTDAIVIPTPSIDNQNPDSFLIFRTLYAKVDKNYKSPIGKVRYNVTLNEPISFSMNGLGYIFVVPPYIGNKRKAKHLLKQTYTSSLELAMQKGYQSVAFPTIGCGIIGFPIADAAASMYTAFEEFCGTKPGKQMKEIRIVVFDQNIYDEFIASIIKCGSGKIKIHNRIPVSRGNSNLSEMSSGAHGRQDLPRGNNDSHEFNQKQRGKENDKDRRHNAQSPEFQPSSSRKKRILRHFVINDCQTELIIVQGDILNCKVDAIVNAANEHMLGGGGVDGVIHEAAGDNLLRACMAHKEIHPNVRLPIGRSRILLSYNLKKTTYYIINTSGPCYGDASPAESKKQLKSCYETSLALANLYDLNTIGFTAISCGIFSYPLDEGAEVALKTVAKNAGLLRQIWFVLKDDKIYDAWIQKAEELNFLSLNDDNTKEASRHTDSPTKKVETPNKPIANKDPQKVEATSAAKRADESETGDSQKPPESIDREDPRRKATAADEHRKSMNKQKNTNEENNKPINDDKSSTEQSKRKAAASNVKEQSPTDSSSKVDQHNILQNHVASNVIGEVTTTSADGKTKNETKL